MSLSWPQGAQAGSTRRDRPLLNKANFGSTLREGRGSALDYAPEVAPVAHESGANEDVRVVASGSDARHLSVWVRLYAREVIVDDT
jgi:hypothetical protein